MTDFCVMTQNQFDTKIKVVRTDNGIEFLNHSCQQFFSSQGIIHQNTYPCTSQENGRVEIKHKYLLLITRAIQFQASLPLTFWGEALLHATYIRNKLPTPVLNWASPHEWLYSQPPDLFQLKVFGCLAYVSNPNPHKTKFEPRAVKCVYLGVASNKKGHKIYDLTTKRLFASRDVVWYKEVFPFLNEFFIESANPPLISPITSKDNENPHSNTPEVTPSSPHVSSTAKPSR